MAFRWGVIGCGVIAGKFSEAIAQMDDVVIEAIADINHKAAIQFANDNQIKKVFETADELFKYPDIDAVYLAAPNSSHYALTKSALLAGRNVLCEKPFMLNSKNAEELIRLAREKKCFLSEGLWTKTLPLYAKLKEFVSDGKIGKINVITADYFFRAPFQPNSRLFNKELGGGALFDIGIYGLVLTSMFLGTNPIQVRSVASIGETKVDEHTSVSLLFENGAVAHLVCSLRTSAPQKAVIMGTKGRIEILEFGRAQKALLYVYKEEQLEEGGNSLRKGTRRNEPESDIIEISCPHKINGFEFEIAAVMQAIRQGQLECDLITHQDTVNQLKIMEAAMAQW